MKQPARALVILLILVTIPALASTDGTLTAPPAAETITRFEVRSITIDSATPVVSISINWYTASNTLVQFPPAAYPRDINLTGAKIAQFLAAVSPASTDTFSGTANAAKRFRQRATKWLSDNSELTNITNEP